MKKALVLITTEAGLEGLLFDEIQKLHGISQVYNLYGEYDLLVVVEEENEQKIREIILWEIRKLNGIKSTNTMMVVQ